MIRRSVVCHLKKNLFRRYHKFPQTKPRLDGPALAGLDTRPGQSPHEAGYLAWLGLAYFSLALAGSRPQAGPGKTLIKGEEVAGWVRDFGEFLHVLNPVNNNRPIVWEHFLDSFRKRFQDSTKENQAWNELEKLQLKTPFIDEYTSKFEELACQANYLAGNPKTHQLFLHGLPRNILEEVMRGGAPPTYQDLKQWVVEAAQSRQTIDNIVRWRDHVPQNPFSNNRQNRLFYYGNKRYDDQQGQGRPPQRQWNSSNAPQQMNNAPVPMDLDRNRMPRQGYRGRGYQAYQGYQGRVAAFREPRGPQPYRPPNRNPAPRGACFKCGQIGH